MMELLRDILFLPPGASTASDAIDQLHFFVIAVTMLGSAAFFGAAVWFAFKYRRRSDQEYTEKYRTPKKRELTVSALLLALFLGWWVIGFDQYGQLHQTPEDPLEIYVTGKQWMWKFGYAGGRSSAGLLVVPVNQPVRLIMTSRDVIHSFYVPAFRIKQDAVPGRYTSIWFEAQRQGTYRAMCAEYCGQSHSRMWADVVVLDAADWERWREGGMPDAVARAKADARARGTDRYGDQGQTTMIAQGEAAAARYGCLGCHTVTGQSHVGPSWRGIFGSYTALQNGERVLVDEDYLTESMMDPEAKRVAGYEAVMPSYRGVLPAPEVAAIVEYIKALEPTDEEPVVRLPPVSATAAPDRLDAGSERLDAGVAADAAAPGDAGRAP